MTKGIYHQAIRLLQKEGNLDHHSHIIQELVTEIKRLRVELCAAKHHIMRRDEDIANLMKEIAAKDALNNDLMANCNQLRDRCWKAEGELDRWQKITIEERAKHIKSYCKYDDMGLKCDISSKGGWCDACTQPSKIKAQAAKELNLQVTIEAGYVDRLEKEFLDVYPYAEIGWSMHGYPIEFSEEERQTAQAALEKIRGGK